MKSFMTTSLMAALLAGTALMAQTGKAPAPAPAPARRTFLEEFLKEDTQ